jgi:hypothetical protein
MAELALYGNENEPRFPYELLRGMSSYIMEKKLIDVGQLSTWLPDYLAQQPTNIPGCLDELLNVILVFARARTSSFQAYSYDKVRNLVKWLNSAAESVGASHHKMELVRRGPHSHFITCSKSPRFNWRISLTHRDIGMNLDYFAPGHMLALTGIPYCTVYFIEENTLQRVMSEFVSMDCISDSIMREKFRRFNRTKENLFNEAMEGFGLDYRFKCVVRWPDSLDCIKKVLEDPTPPPLSWWDDCGYLVNLCSIPGMSATPTHCFVNFQAQHEAYWPLIQDAFHFSIKYKRSRWYCHRCRDKNTEYWKKMEIVMTRIRDACERDFDQEEFDLLRVEMKLELLLLAEKGDELIKCPYTITRSHFKRPSRTLKRLRMFFYKLRTIKDAFYLYTFQRQKLRRPLVRMDMPECPEEGTHDAFEMFLK